MKNFMIICMLILYTCIAYSRTKPVDEIDFGNDVSEKNHKFHGEFDKIIKGEFGERARVLLPVDGERVEGGSLTFRMKVSPDQQNYFTVKLWGGDTGNSNILILFCEGKQIGYRHLGDYDMLDISNDDAPFPGRFSYKTLPIPLTMTKGKKNVVLSIHSTGYIFRYGESFDQYQKPMSKPSKAIYRGYTHIETCFVPSVKECQGKAPVCKKRISPGSEVMGQLKELVNKRLSQMLEKKELSQEELWVLADAYYMKWTNVYRDRRIVEKAIETADHYYYMYLQDHESVYRQSLSWCTVGPLCMALNSFVPEIRERLDEKMSDGNTRRHNWAAMFKECIDYAVTHRRQYTNQCMIVDLHIYSVNRILAVISPDKALPEYQTRKYLYEAMGIIPWTGSETPHGSSMPLGNHYYQLTDKGLTKELGYVGGYGEIFNWMVHIYEVTGVRANVDSRDPLIRAQLLKMMKARSFFRYPSLDNDGNKAMRAEAVVGWRDHDYYPSQVMYGEKNGRESTPIMAAASTLDPLPVSFAQQMMDDNQFFSLVAEKMKDGTLNSIHTMLRIPDEYELIKQQPHRKGLLPMSEGMPDTIFSDEEDGVLALKNGDEILYASLYWRANFAVNSLARIHYMTPDIERVSTVFQHVEYTSSGFVYKRPERVNLFFSDNRNFYPEIKSAHTGDELPIAKTPDGIDYKLGQESVYAGRCDFYVLPYGKYLIGMNCTKDKTFKLKIPQGKQAVLFPSKKKLNEYEVSVTPMSTVVLILK